MTVNINIEKGDRVRAVSKTVEGDFSVFQVTSVTLASRGYESRSNFFSSEEFDFELLAKAPKPTPTQSGIYEFEENGDAMRNLVLTTKGVWYWLDMTGEDASDIFEPVRGIDAHIQQGLKLVFAEKG